MALGNKSLKVIKLKKQNNLSNPFENNPYEHNSGKQIGGFHSFNGRISIGSDGKSNSGLSIAGGIFGRNRDRSRSISDAGSERNAISDTSQLLQGNVAIKAFPNDSFTASLDKKKKIKLTQKIKIKNNKLYSDIQNSGKKAKE
jgi:hypothetical protein